MYTDRFDQSPEQDTLTNQWHHTRMQGRDNAEIEMTQKVVAAEKKKKYF